VSASAGPRIGASLGVGDGLSGGLGGGLGRGRGRGTGARALRSARYYLPAAVVLVVAIVGWELIFSVLKFESFLVPKPSAIVAALQANWSGGRFPLLPSAIATFQEAVLGLAIGTVAGVVVAFASARWLTARGILLPLAVAANAVPIIAFAPLLNNWFGLLNPLSKALMAAVLVFFPVMANVTRGLVQVEPGALELMRSYAASDWAILRKVRIPNALPYFFTAMKIATTLSLIGAIVGEYFGGANSVLGRLIVNSASALKFDITWAAILFGAITGIAFYLVVVLIERLVIPWAATMRADS
jgi:NitT/TauT family transport system permease protein